MKNSILMGALVLTIALVPSFASAGTKPYDLAINSSDWFHVAGSLPVSLDPDQGDAMILSALPDGFGYVDVLVYCKDTSTVRCQGDVVAT